ncbi:MAG: extradiol ring-cleavage dioxygenase [Halomonas sp.]|nr:VOC family protein [Halomonas sp.]TVP44627.1 MAG: extradiol ring-cleavage dioxygenase [Halomonas sp.]
MNSPSTSTSVFGLVRTGYAVISTRRLDEWKRFGGEALGLHMDVRSANVVSFRVDERERRLIVQSGQHDDFAALGLEVLTDEALAEILSRLRGFGISITEVSGEEAALRGVDAFWAFEGPKRQKIELFRTAATTDAPLTLGVSGFLTGDSGLGHLAITSAAPDAMIDFWQTVFDARRSDRIEANMSGVNLLITFLRLNERHHSIAVARTKGVLMDPIPTRIQHMAMEVASLDDVTDSYIRCRKLGFRMAQSVGQHTNDREISYYVISPSGFEIEIGWNPLRVDESGWDDSTVHQGTSFWGHNPLDIGIGDRLKQGVSAVKSLVRKEYTPLRDKARHSSAGSSL